MDKVLYEAEKTCPLCGKRFQVTRVKSRLTMTSQDSDFCTYYKEVNPNYYSIWYCLHCGYAAQDTYFEEFPPFAEKIKTFLAKRKISVRFDGMRTREQAIATYKLAIYFAEMGLVLSSRIASLYLKLAWLYREGMQTEEELAMLEKARCYYEQAYMREKLPIGNISELTMEYLLGELLRRTGKLDEAIGYLGQVISNPGIKNEKRIRELARQAWHQAKEDKNVAIGGDPG